MRMGPNSPNSRGRSLAYLTLGLLVFSSFDPLWSVWPALACTFIAARTMTAAHELV